MSYLTNLIFILTVFVLLNRCATFNSRIFEDNVGVVAEIEDKNCNIQNCNDFCSTNSVNAYAMCQKRGFRRHYSRTYCTCNVNLDNVRIVNNDGLLNVCSTQFGEARCQGGCENRHGGLSWGKCIRKGRFRICTCLIYRKEIAEPQGET